jgi:acetoin utilization deacetylase AcuC-like enzyme
MPVLALVRPPGHHAERGRAMGFCLFNSIAVAAADALDRGLDRIAIVDYDVHHGNGTQSIFYDDPRVLYVSTHQYPYYPGSGSADETGSADGLGFTLNAPFEAGATDGDYLAVFDRVIVPVLQEFRPRLVLVSAGFDAHRHDPLGGMRLSTTGYARLTRRLLQVAEDGADGAIALVTEGGYSLPALAACLEAVLSVLRGAPDDAEPPSPATHRAAETIDAIRAAHRGSWVMSL